MFGFLRQVTSAVGLAEGPGWILKAAAMCRETEVK